MSELKPCPFCGSADIDCADAGYKTDVWFVQCNNCYATFPHFDSKEEAATAWNTRTPQNDEVRK
jgi:Lar family restriction alleviation protein